MQNVQTLSGITLNFAISQIGTFGNPVNASACRVHVHFPYTHYHFDCTCKNSSSSTGCLLL